MVVEDREERGQRRTDRSPPDEVRRKEQQTNEQHPVNTRLEKLSAEISPFPGKQEVGVVH